MVGLLFAALLAVIVGALVKSYFEVREKEEERQRGTREAEIRWARAEERHNMRVAQGLEPPMNCDGCGNWLGPEVSPQYDVACPGCGHEFHPACLEKHWEKSESCWKKHLERYS